MKDRRRGIQTVTRASYPCCAMVRSLVSGVVIAVVACAPQPPPLTPVPAPLEVMPIAKVDESVTPRVATDVSAGPTESERALQDWSPEKSQCAAYDYFPN